MRNLFIILLLALFSLTLFAQTGGKGKAKSSVQYQYKQKEVFDFGELTIQGNVLTPGDITVKKRKRKKFRTQFRTRNNFDREIRVDLKEVE